VTRGYEMVDYVVGTQTIQKQEAKNGQMLYTCELLKRYGEVHIVRAFLRGPIPVGKHWFTNLLRARAQPCFVSTGSPAIPKWQTN